MAETLQKETVVAGNGTDKPKAGDMVTMHYTGWLYEPGKAQNRGNQYGSFLDKISKVVADYVQI